MKTKVLWWDFIHVFYNLLYPAILGGFIYALVWEGPSSFRFGWWGCLAGWMVALLYSIDFLLGKKLYECCGENLPGMVVVLEVGIVLSLVGAFDALRTNGFFPNAYVQYFSVSLFVFASCINIFYSKMPGPSRISWKVRICSIGVPVLMVLCSSLLFPWIVLVCGSGLVAAIGLIHYVSGTESDSWPGRCIFVSSSVEGCSQGRQLSSMVNKN